MRKSIIIFDFNDPLRSGEAGIPDTGDSRIRRGLQAELTKERQRRASTNEPVLEVDIYFPSGGGYHLLCTPDLDSVLDITQRTMAFLDIQGMSLHCVIHIGEVEVYTDMSGRKQATGRDIGHAIALCRASGTESELICSVAIVNIWHENDYFDLHSDLICKGSEDELEYCWQVARPK